MGAKTGAYLLALMLFMLTFSVQAQLEEGDAIIKKIGNKKYYIHTVEPGHTLYAISKKYSVSIEDIVEANREAEDGLSINQVLIIPVKKVDKQLAKDNPPAMDGGYLLHKVQPKETLYALSKKYNVQIEDILEHNAEAIDGLREGSEVKIPTRKIKTADVTMVAPAREDSLLAHEVLAQETLYSLSKIYHVSEDSIKLVNNGLPLGLQVGATIRIPKLRNPPKPVVVDVPVETYTCSNGVQYEIDTAVFRKTYNVALMLPFYLDLNDTIAKNKRAFEKDMIHPKSTAAIEFYEGALIAIDSLRNKGLNVRLHSYDTRADTSVVKLLLQRDEMRYMSLFIGPLHTNNFELVSAFAKDRKVPVVCPIRKTNRILLDNEHVSKVYASLPMQLEVLANHVLELYPNNQVMLINSMKLSDERTVSTFKNKANSILARRDSVNADTIQELKIWTVTESNIKYRLNPDTLNVLVVASQDEAFINTLLTELNKIKESFEKQKKTGFEVRVYGTEKWLGFEEKMDVSYLHALQVHVTSPSHVDYSLPEVTDYLKRFREAYKTDPGPFGFYGFDVSYYYLSALQQFGTAFQSNLTSFHQNTISYRFDFAKTGLESGYENGAVFILKYEDFKLKRVN